MCAVTLTSPVANPETQRNGESLFEVVNGKRVELPATSIYAAWIASRFHGILWPFVEKGALGTLVAEALFILDVERDTRRRPDIAFVSAAKWPLDRPLPETGDWQLAPDLAVEVISPNDIFNQVVSKVGEYFDHGTTQVWLVLPSQREVYVYSAPTQVRIFTDLDTLEGEPLLPGFQLPLANLFQKKQAGR
jgi:Uma2 family endonuclease